MLAAPAAEAVQPADLSLTKTVSNPGPAIGAQVTFTVTVTNSSAVPVQRTVIRDLLPAGYAFVSYTATRGSYTANTGQWNNVALPAHQTAQLRIVAKVRQSGSRINAAEIISSTNPDPDSTPGNGNHNEDDYAQVAVNIQPRITGQRPLSTPEDTPLTVQTTDLTIVDPDSTNFTLTLQPGSNYTLETTTRLKPVANYSGTLTVGAIVNDGVSNSAQFNLTVTVTPVNDPPVVNGQSPISAPEDTARTVQLADLSFADPDGPGPFTLALQPGDNYTLESPTRLRPVSNYNGTLTVPVTVSDGLISSAPFNLTVTVTPVNDAPVIGTQNPVSTPEDTARTVLLSDLNVADPDGPGPFILTLQPGANYTLGSPTQLQPVHDYNGTLNVPVTVNDGLSDSATFGLLVTVTPVNDPPVILDQHPLSAAQGTPLAIMLDDVIVDDPDSPFGSLVLTVEPGAGYALTGPNEITPDADFTGPLTVSVLVSDDVDASAVFPLIVTVTETPDVAPVISGQAGPLSTAEETPLTLTLADLVVEDPDNLYPDDFTLTVLDGPNYAVTGDAITPDVDYDGDLSVPVVVSDGLSSSDPFDLQVTVTPVDDAPVITGQDALSTHAHTPIVITLDELAVTDPDNPKSEMTLTLLPGSDYQITGTDELTPDTGFAGDLTVPATVNDGTEDSDVYDLVVNVTAPTLPNVITIMVDDLDNRTLSDMLNAGLLPHVQASIVDRSMAFTESHVTTPLCCPSRASFYSGQYPHNTGIVSNQLRYTGNAYYRAVGKFDDSVTLATRLQALGYTTAHIGKWLNGYGSDASLTALSPSFDPHYVPPGWSTWYGLVDLSTYCMYNYTVNHDGSLTTYSRPQGQSEDTATYQTNVLAGMVEAFVQQHRSDAAPFYLDVTPVVPHAEWCPDAYGAPIPPPGEGGFDLRIRPAPEHKNASVPAYVPMPNYDEDLADKPAFLSGVVPLTASDLASISEQYQGRMRAMLSFDDLVGRLFDALGSAADNSIIVFTSDNGWLYGEHRLSGKIYAYEESSAVPLYIALPGSTAARTSSELVLNNDLTPTLMDLVSPGYADARFDGRSLAPLLRDGAPGPWNRVQFLIEYARTLPVDASGIPTYMALRNATSIYIETYGGTYYSPTQVPLIGLEAYDLVNDPYEINSVIHSPEDARDPVLGPWLDLLHACQGSSCAQYEDALMP